MHLGRRLLEVVPCALVVLFLEVLLEPPEIGFCVGIAVVGHGLAQALVGALLLLGERLLDRRAGGRGGA